MQSKIILILICSIYFLNGLNLTIHFTQNPPNHEMLDVEIAGNILIVPGNLGGMAIYDIANPESPELLTTYEIGGCKPYHVEVKEDILFASCKNNGIVLVDISNPGNPDRIGNIDYPPGDDFTWEDISIQDDLLAVSVNNDGVLFFDISVILEPQFISQLITDNAWTTILSNNHLYVADGEAGIKIYEITDLDNPDLISFITTNDVTKDLALDGHLLYAAIGSGGVDLYNVSDPVSPEYLANFNSSGMANRIDLFDGKLALSDWLDVKILEWNGADLELIGYKNTSGRAMAIHTLDNYIFSAEWSNIVVFEYGEITGSDLDLDEYVVNFPLVENGESDTLYLELMNNGNSVLEINTAFFNWGEFSTTTDINNLAPGELQIVDIIYTAGAVNASGQYIIQSNDPDESMVSCVINGNINGIDVGEPAPDFELPIAANGTGNFQLSDYLGKVVVLAFFHPT